MYICYKLLSEKHIKILPFNKLIFNHNLHSNCRWHCYITDDIYAVAPSSVPLVWSQLLTVFYGTFVLNTVSIIRHYIYSMCQGLYLCEAVRDLQIIVQYYCREQNSKFSFYISSVSALQYIFQPILICSKLFI